MGNHEGLLKLRDTLTIIINNPQYGEICEVFVNDGEGYDIGIKMINNINILPVPYTADYAQDKSAKNINEVWNSERLAES